MVDDDCATVGQCFDGMADASRHDGDHSRSGDLDDAVDGHLKLALGYLVDFFLRMEMLVDGCATSEIEVREGHAGRVEVASMPARQALGDAEAADVHKGHGRILPQQSKTPPAK